MSLENILVDLKEPECTECSSVPPKVPPGACERGLIWKQGLCRYNQIQMWSYWIRPGPISNMAGALIRRGKSECRDTQRCPVKMGAEMEGCVYEPREANVCKEGPSARAFGANTVLPTP